MKTFEDWDNSDLNLDEYLAEPCEIDEDLANYIGECVAPVYVTPEFVQGGDAMKEVDDVYFYSTVSRIGEKYFYLGILPEFKQ